MTIPEPWSYLLLGLALLGVVEAVNCFDIVIRQIREDSDDS